MSSRLKSLSFSRKRCHEDFGKKACRALGFRALRLETLERRALLSATTPALDLAADVTPDYPPRRSLYQLEGYLTEPSKAPALEIARDFLLTQKDSLEVSTADLQHTTVTDQYVDAITGLTHIYLCQEYNGLPIVNSRMGVHVAEDGRVLAAMGGFVGGLEHAQGKRATPALSAIAAFDHAAVGLGLSSAAQETEVVSSAAGDRQSQILRNAKITPDDVPAELEYVATPQGLRLSWSLLVKMPDTPDRFNMSVDAESGAVLQRQNRVSYASYKAFAAPNEGPLDGSGSGDFRTVVTDPQFADASPYGWHDDNGPAPGGYSISTHGNNTWAGVDRSNVYEEPPNAPSSSTLYFVYGLNPRDGNPLAYQDASATNLFYWVNTLHDVFYRYGFTEAAGNFQNTNFSGYGYGNDSVMAHSMEYDKTNTSWFETVPEPAGPNDKIRMQIGICDESLEDRDGALDSMLIVHEYAHGVTRRLTGGPSQINWLASPESNQLGEGLSQWFGLMFTMKSTDTFAGEYEFGKWSGLSFMQRVFRNSNTDAPTYAEVAVSNYRIPNLVTATLLDMYWEIRARNDTFATLGTPFVRGGSNAANVTAL